MALLARRLSTGTLLRVALLAQAAGFASWLGMGPTGGGDAFGVPIRSAADACLMAGTTTLVLRAAPRGREALAYALLLAVPTFLGSGLLLPLALGLRLGWHATVVAAIAVSVVVALAVPLLPRELSAGRDGVAPRNAQGTG
jgi:hypothetical protein